MDIRGEQNYFCFFLVRIQEGYRWTSNKKQNSGRILEIPWGIILMYRLKKGIEFKKATDTEFIKTFFV